MSNKTGASALNADGVTINVMANNRIFEILGTLLFCAAVGMISYAMAQQGWLEIAATTLTMFLFQLGRLLVANGLMAVPDLTGGTSDFASTRGVLRTAWVEFGVWQQRSPVWRLAALAALYTATFMVARWLVGVGLTAFENVWIAGGAAALLAALIIFPQLISNAVKRMSRRAPEEPAQSTASSSD